MCDNVQNCCRICLDRESDHVPILEDPIISLHLKSCLSVSVSPNDHLPKAVCVSCVSLLKQFYNFQLKARCSQHRLESLVQEKIKKTSEDKVLVQPLPDSESNSDSLLDFLNNTDNIKEYLKNLGKEDIPSRVNMLDKNEHNIEIAKSKLKTTKAPSPDRNDAKKIKKDTDPKTELNQVKVDKNTLVCFGCKTKCDNVPKLLQHMSICTIALRTCVHCNMLFNSKQQMQQHSVTHNTSVPLTCKCREQFSSKTASVGCVYLCKVCGDTFEDRFQLYEHAKVHIITLDSKVCEICGLLFKGNDALTKHQTETHEKHNNVMYRCKICNFTSSDRKETYRHVKNHTAKPETSRSALV